MGNDRVDVETSVAGLIEILDDDAVDRMLETIESMQSLVMVSMDAEGAVTIQAATLEEDGMAALIAATNLYGAGALECHRRFIACLSTLRQHPEYRDAANAES